MIRVECEWQEGKKKQNKLCNAQGTAAHVSRVPTTHSNEL